jgi:hypothetical protein
LAYEDPKQPPELEQQEREFIPYKITLPPFHRSVAECHVSELFQKDILNTLMSITGPNEMLLSVDVPSSQSESGGA